MRWLALGILGLLLALLAVLVAVRAGDGPLSGLRIGGERLDPDQPLEAQLQQRAQIYGEQLVTIRAGSSAVKLMRKKLGASLDVEDVLRRTRAVGRSGHPIADLRKLWLAWRDRLDVPWDPAVDDEVLGEFVANERDRLELPPKVGVSDGQGWSLPGEDGVTLDYHQAMARLKRSLRMGKSSIELSLTTVPQPEPIVIGTPDGALFDPSEAEAAGEVPDPGEAGPDEIPASVVAGIQWMPSRGPECFARPPMPDFCEGPRMVPRALGRNAQAADDLGLGGLPAVRRILTRSPDPRWVAAAGGPLGRQPLIWPVASGRFGRGFGFVRKRIEVRDQLHKGVDIGARLGSAIRAASAGIVAYADNGIRGYGNLLILVHADGAVTFSAHTRRIFVAPGQRVAAGQIVAEVGSTGMSLGPHLHFEYHLAGRPTDPDSLFVQRPRGRR